MRSGYLFRGRKISRKIQIREYSENFLHAKNTCYTVFQRELADNRLIVPRHNCAQEILFGDTSFE